MQGACTAAGKAHPDVALVLLSCDAESDRVAACASVPKALQAEIDCGALLRAALAPVGGKGGGKGGSAVGQGVGAARLAACVGEAKKFLEGFVDGGGAPAPEPVAPAAANPLYAAPPPTPAAPSPPEPSTARGASSPPSAKKKKKMPGFPSCVCM